MLATFLIVGIIAGAHRLDADTLVLRNGERLKGKVVRIEGAQVVFQSQALGEVRVPRNQVVAWPESYPLAAAESVALEAQQPPGDPVPDKPAAPAAAAPKAVATPAPPKQEVAVEPSLEVVAAAEPEPVQEPEQPSWWARMGTSPWWLWWKEHRPMREWRTSLHLGYRLSEALIDREDLNLRFETSRRTESGEYRFTGRYDYADTTDQAGVTSRAADRLQGGARLRHDLAPRVYLQANTRYLADAVARIDRELEQSVGVGWRLVDSPKVRATVTPSATLQNQEIANQVSRWNTNATLFQDFRFKINERFTFYEEADFSVSPEDREDYQVRFNARLEAKLSSAIAADLRYELDIDSTISSTSERSQSRVLFTLGLRF